MKDVVPGWKLMDEFASDKADLKDMLGELRRAHASRPLLYPRLTLPSIAFDIAHRSGLPRHDMMAAANDSIESIVRLPSPCTRLSRMLTAFAPVGSSPGLPPPVPPPVRRVSPKVAV